LYILPLAHEALAIVERLGRRVGEREGGKEEEDRNEE
jgi:hypothetical protein